MTVMVTFPCIVGDSGFKSEVDEELRSEGGVGPFCWSSKAVSDGESLGHLGLYHCLSPGVASALQT